MVVAVLAVYACSRSEDEVVYSCDERLDEWAHVNLRSIRSMDREAWLNLDEEYKRPAFNALTPEQKILFWKEKLTEVMTSFQWSEAEMDHLMKLFRYLDEHPDMYEPEVMTDSVRNASYRQFVVQWKGEVMIDLDWSEELIYGILYTGNRLLDKEGHYQTKVMKRVQTKIEAAPDESCSCNTVQEDSCVAGCTKVLGCGAFGGDICNGTKKK